jgi:hypothetical protein
MKPNPIQRMAQPAIRIGALLVAMSLLFYAYQDVGYDKAATLEFSVPRTQGLDVTETLSRQRDTYAYVLPTEVTPSGEGYGFVSFEAYPSREYRTSQVKEQALARALKFSYALDNGQRQTAELYMGDMPTRYAIPFAGTAPRTINFAADFSTDAERVVLRGIELVRTAQPLRSVEEGKYARVNRSEIPDRSGWSAVWRSTQQYERPFVADGTYLSGVQFFLRKSGRGGNGDIRLELRSKADGVLNTITAVDIAIGALDRFLVAPQKDCGKECAYYELPLAAQLERGKEYVLAVVGSGAQLSLMEHVSFANAIDGGVILEPVQHVQETNLRLGERAITFADGSTARSYTMPAWHDSVAGYQQEGSSHAFYDTKQRSLMIAREDALQWTVPVDTSSRRAVIRLTAAPQSVPMVAEYSLDGLTWQVGGVLSQEDVAARVLDISIPQQASRKSIALRLRAREQDSVVGGVLGVSRMSYEVTALDYE